MTTRRQFLKNASLTATALALAPGAFADESPAPAKAPAPGGKPPRRVIFMISDGMSIGIPSMAEQFSQLVRGKGTHFAALLSNPKAAHGFFDTQSLSSLVTDSAAAATALGSGTRVFNGAINVLPDGRELRPIHHLLKEKGFGTGLVTTARVTHATPAGFGSVQPRRDDEDLIAPQYNGKVDVILGGGARHFDADRRRADKNDVAGEYEKAGYAVVRDKTALAAVPKDKRILGLFDNSHVPYTIDHMNDEKLKATVPTLAEMTKSALTMLEQNPKGFLLQVEGARIDHFHGNDAAAALWDQIAFDDAIEAALEFQQRNPDTLIVVTSDHGTANPGLNGMGNEYVDSTECFGRIANAKSSCSNFEWRLRKSGSQTAETAQKMIAEDFGLSIPLEDCALVAEASQGKDVAEINVLQRGFSGILAQVLGNHTGVGWTGCNHTQDMVVSAATGPGQDAFLGLLKNTDAFKNMGIPKWTPRTQRPTQALSPRATKSIGHDAARYCRLP